ncbi:hypothetical protein F5Y08DRAFT_172262 [Xylaria arbuscula]|nr:hypothetical protein F5Y08DRAFT_172262 [Xylaria arbuscula]
MPDSGSIANDDVVGPQIEAPPAGGLPEPSSTDTGPAPDSALGSGPPPNTRRCFVCLTDEPEDELPSDWATPCRCSLEGHQECLLAWVNDLEAQAKDVACPVCKSPIIVTERYSPAIQLSNFLNNKFTRWSPRILLGFIASGALISSSVYGLKAISWFAGPDAVVSFLLSENEAITATNRIRRRPLHEQTVNLIHLSVLPLIAPALVLNRMDGIGDIVTLPASLVYATLFNHSAEFFLWPPSPDRILTIYPVIKTTYFHIHRALSDRLEKSWVARARAMNVEPGADAAHEFAPLEPAPAMNILDLEIDIQIGEPDAQPRNRVAEAGRSPINFITGALLYPSVCYGVGELMRLMLPSRFITKPPSGSPTGLLQERWGRSFIGGCLFVVLKDAFFLYVKYKKIMNRPSRRIKNSDRRDVHN